MANVLSAGSRPAAGGPGVAAGFSAPSLTFPPFAKRSGDFVVPGSHARWGQSVKSRAFNSAIEGRGKKRAVIGSRI
jgi:hypothetical protein